MRPLDHLQSIKAKLTVVIVAVLAVSTVVSTVGLRTGIPVWLRPVISLGVALLFVYPFARGITSPLREMVAASRAMAAGDYSQPVTVTSSDEVGELARSFTAMRAELDLVDRQRRELIANVSHELRTPLASLRARFENIVDGVEELDADNVERTLREVERLGRLVEQLLDLGRIESGAWLLHVEAVDVDLLLQRVCDRVDRPDPTVELRHNCDHGLVLQADPTRLEQVAVNLVDNAIRHAPSNTTVDAAATWTQRGMRLVVTDAGPGIAPEERARVFERFYRSDHARSSGDGGSGIGLAIVRGIVDLHHGTITITSNGTAGCRVVVDLPHAEEQP